MQTDLLQDLTEEQIEAVAHLDGPCLVVAGAGTGKTTVLTRRIAYLIQKQQVPAEQIIALTFTDKAAREMEERVDQLLPYGTTSTTISTFHSFCAEVVKRHAFLLGLDPAARLLSTADEITFLRQHLHALPTKLYKPSKNPVEFLKALTQFISKAKDEFVNPSQVAVLAQQWQKSAETEAAQEEAAKLAELAEIYQQVQTLYAENSLLSYADLIYYTLVLFNTFPSARAAEQQRFRYLLIDEFQDTNFSQNEIARALVEPHQNIMVVGDDDQAIYRFRGANIANIMQFSSFFPQSKVITLRDNFRSCQPILDSAYRLIQYNNPNRLEIKEKISKQLISHHSSGMAPEHWHYERSIFEYQKVAQEINALISKGAYKPEEIAILVRAKNHAKGLENSLKAQGITFQYSGDIKFYQQKYVQIAHSFLRFLTDPDDDLNCFALLVSDPFNVPERALQIYSNKARYQSLSLYEFLEQETEVDPLLSSALNYLRGALADQASRSASQALLLFLHSSGWYALLQENHLATNQLAMLHEEITAFESTHQSTSLPYYMQHIDHLIASEEDISLQQPPEIVPEGVQIMTVHKSKGLEFPVVFIINLVEGRFPARNQGETIAFPSELTHGDPDSREERLAEERRLFYVAMTRAKERLYLSSSELYEERKTKAKPSPFLSEALSRPAPTALRLNQPEQLIPFAPTPLPQKDRTVLKMPKAFSPSALETYQSCAQKYYYQYVLTIKTPGSHFVNFGISLHQSLQKWFTAKIAFQNPDIEAIYRESWIKGGYISKQHEQERYKEGLEKLTQYLTDHQDEPLPSQLEYAFQVKLKDGQLLTGKIDRVDQLKNQAVGIIDYKTGDRLPAMRELPFNLQLGSYALALEQKGMQVEEVSLHFIMTGDILKIPRADLQTEAIKQTIDELITNISHSMSTQTFIAQPEKKKCEYCDYREICPFRYGKVQS